MSKKKIGNPAVVGLAGFGLTTMLLQFHNLGLCGIGPVAAMGFMFGGLAQMIAGFMEQMKNKGFRTMIKDQFIKHTDACVEDFVSGNIKSLFGNLKQLSNVVLDNFKPMNPAEFHRIWKDGIDTNEYYLKLCGSGGGGYILGFTEDFEKAKNSLKGHKLEVVYNF